MQLFIYATGKDNLSVIETKNLKDCFQFLYDPLVNTFYLRKHLKKFSLMIMTKQTLVSLALQFVFNIFGAGEIKAFLYFNYYYVTGTRGLCSGSEKEQKKIKSARVFIEKSFRFRRRALTWRAPSAG